MLSDSHADYEMARCLNTPIVWITGDSAGRITGHRVYSGLEMQCAELNHQWQDYYRHWNTELEHGR